MLDGNPFSIYLIYNKFMNINEIHKLFPTKSPKWISGQLKDHLDYVSTNHSMKEQIKYVNDCFGSGYQGVYILCRRLFYLLLQSGHFPA